MKEDIREDIRAGVILCLMLLLLILSVFVVTTLSHEITKNGDAKRCAEYNYECKGDSNGTTQD